MIKTNKLFLSILLIGLLILLVLYLYSTSGSMPGISNEKPISKNEHETLVEKPNTKMTGVFSITSPTPETEEFNQYVFENISEIGTSLKPTVLSNLFENIDYDDIDSAADQLMMIMKDPVNHQLVMRDMFSYCEALRKRERSTVETSENSQITGENILLALQKSKYCNHIGTNSDPFYIILDLARKGDKIAQLFLADDLFYAVERGLINPKLYPIEYNDLRNEIIDYLRALSARGVVQATINLQKVYTIRNFLLPKDEVKAYYYAVLSEKQSNGQVIYDHPSDQLYDWLTESQKSRADRMTEKLK